MSDKEKYLGIRINNELKREFIEFCNSKQVSQASVLHYFMKKSVEIGKLPFTKDEIYMLESKSSNGSNVTKVSLRIKDMEVKEKFKKLCASYGLSMAGAVKLFFRKCISTGNLPF